MADSWTPKVGDWVKRNENYVGCQTDRIGMPTRVARIDPEWPGCFLEDSGQHCVFQYLEPAAAPASEVPEYCCFSCAIEPMCKKRRNHACQGKSYAWAHEPEQRILVCHHSNDAGGAKR